MRAGGEEEIEEISRRSRIYGVGKMQECNAHTQDHIFHQICAGFSMFNGGFVFKPMKSWPLQSANVSSLPQGKVRGKAQGISQNFGHKRS